MANEILEDDLIAVAAASIIYMQITGDMGVVDALQRIGNAMEGIGDGDVRVVKSHGFIDPNIKARMRLAEEIMGVEG